MSNIEQYDYDLPDELVAQHPLRNRTDARLLVVDRSRQEFDHLYVRDLPELLGPRDTLVLNDTRVLPARLVGHRKRTKGKWQGLFLASEAGGNWCVMCKTRGKLEPGETIVLHDSTSRDCLELRMIVKQDNGNWVCRPRSDERTQEILQRVGRVPLPPYIRSGEMVPGDIESYQTIYAENPGAVAAPTAGLHFTEGLLDRIQQRGTQICRVTLHVGVGTFRPISVDSLSDHRMHSEWGSIDSEVATHLRTRRQEGGRTIAIGTTSVRVLETAARAGTLESWRGTTDLFIRPPYQFQAVDALMTNFHLPKSTLLVLVRSFGGDDLLVRAYQEAIEQQYRFYSYGDAMLIV